MKTLLAALLLAAAPAQASALFASEVIRVAETYRGPRGESATLKVPSRVLVALNAASDTLLVPLSEDYAEPMLRHRDRAR